MLKRRFVDLPHGQVHLREGGAGFPLLMLHASPGSGRQLASFAADLALHHRIIAPDTPGHGDSVPLPQAAPVIGDYARMLPHLLDALDVGQIDVYGSHTGASIAAELAVIVPDRVRRVVFDGIGIFTGTEQNAFLTHYAHPFTPDLDGSYLMRAFQFCRDQYLFFPWYDRTAAARRQSGLGQPADFHAWLVEVLKAAETYHLAYRAAFSWDAAAVLTRITQPTLAMASHDDPLFACTRDAAALVERATFSSLPMGASSGFSAARAAVVGAFLGADAAGV
jgi:pimeloyl-ACP methyl ester carboxylesterase